MAMLSNRKMEKESMTMTKCIKKCGIHIYIGQIALLAVLSAGWWGLLYPDLSMTETVFQAVEEEPGSGDSVMPDEKESGRPVSRAEGFFAVLGAEAGEVEVRSRFLDTVSEIFQQ